MKKLIPLFAFALLLLNVSTVFAQQQTYWHSNDYYSIELTGNGNAFVVATINIESLSEKGVSSLTLQVPYTKIQIYKLVQEGGYWYPPCIGTPCYYRDPVYYEPKFLDYTIETLADSTLVRFNLSRPVVNNSQTTIYLVFSTPRIAKQTFQGFEFNFKTIQDSKALTRYVSAGITVPENMELKGKPKFKVDYNPSELATMATSSAKEFVSSIRAPYYGYQQYSAQNLLPGESFTITGLYGENFFLLYFYEIIIGVLTLVIFLFLFYAFIYRKVKRMFARRIEGEEIRRKRGFSFGRAFLAGIFSGFIFVAMFFALTYLSSLIYTGYYWYNPPIQILFFLLEGIVLILSLFGLPYYIGSRYSKSEGFVAGIISLITAFVLLLIISALFPSSPPIIYARTMLEGASEIAVK